MRRGLLIVVAAVMVAAGGAGAASAATRWAVQPTPNPSGAIGSNLVAVSCIASTDCTAVGDYFTPAATQMPLAEHWNGSTWAIQAVPTPAGSTSSGLGGVSCSSSTECIAVGGYYVRHSGKTFTLAERWNGSTWAVQPAKALGVLFGVSCPAPTSCTAVGSGSAGTLAEHWNGSTWAVQATPDPTGSGNSDIGLEGVSCASPARCTAAGWYYNSASVSVTLAEHWNGSTWSIQATPDSASSLGSRLYGVSCATPASCTAVGESYDDSAGAWVTLAEHWTGSTWAIQATPNPKGFLTNSLYGVSCATPASCTAVGAYGPRSNNTRPLAEHWNGSTWAIQAATAPPGSSYRVLSGLWCVSSSTCTGVGHYDSQTLAEAK